jgi:hypothetical protein
MGSTHPLSGLSPLLVLLTGALLACKLGKSDDDPETRPLPAVEGSASAPVQATPPAIPKADAPAAPAKPSEPAAPEPKQGEPAASTTAKQSVTTGAKAGSTTDGGSGTAKQGQTTTSTAEATTGTQKEPEKEQGTTGSIIQPPKLECFQKCAEALRECAKDAQIGDDVMKKCQGAFTTCRNNCS